MRVRDRVRVRVRVGARLARAKARRAAGRSAAAGRADLGRYMEICGRYRGDIRRNMGDKGGAGLADRCPR